MVLLNMVYVVEGCGYNLKTYMIFSCGWVAGLVLIPKHNYWLCGDFFSLLLTNIIYLYRYWGNVESLLIGILGIHHFM